ncbi:MAG TPA: penicillin-binding transpeptidase domain-containing protein [Pirellulales bacterium]|nr:penicillin-binding transpeptidase domain-containing protein [Pirellulales bacterium]
MIDWRTITAAGSATTVDGALPLRRLRLVVLVGLGVVMLRIMALELSSGAQQRDEAARPIVRTVRTAPMRGRILAADGSVLVRDEPIQALVLHYRWLEQPANDRWLRTQARARLKRDQRRNPERVELEKQRVLAERDDLHARIAALCGLSADEFAVRTAEVQQRVERIAKRVNEQRVDRELRDESSRGPSSDAPWVERLQWAAWSLLLPRETAVASAPIVVAEELEHHVVHDALALEAIAEVEAHPERWPGVRVEQRTRRVYEHGALAAHVVGHTSANAEPVGRMGLERHYDRQLRGVPGTIEERSDRTGRLIDRREVNPAQPGTDLLVTLDVALQRSAERLLDDTLRHGALAGGPSDPTGNAGAAVIALDVRTGAVYCAAAAPRFEPSRFSSPDAHGGAALLADPRRPLFDRATKMALPPGSVFKAITAIALMEGGGFDPEEPYFCRGYLDRPDRQRCMLFRREGIGHGDTTLTLALMRRCNTYFFYHATALGGEPIADWSRRLGLGQPTGIDLPDEATGSVPNATGDRWTLADTHALAIGQSTLAVTPLQMARVMAAIANGGQLVRPHVVRSIGLVASADEGEGSIAAARQPAPMLRERTLAELREGLERVVNDEQGTGYRTIRIPELPIAGKTGTAETGRGRADHAWFVGYAPADEPRVALAVVVEHGGSGADIAGPIAKRLFMRLAELGYLN